MLSNAAYTFRITNVLDHIFLEFKPFFDNKFRATALYLFKNYGTAEKMAHMNSMSYDNLRRISKGKFSMQKFLKLKDLAKNIVGEDNEIFVCQLNSLLAMYRQAAQEVDTLEKQIFALIEEIKPRSLTIPAIGALSSAVIYAEYGDLNLILHPRCYHLPG